MSDSQDEKDGPFADEVVNEAHARFKRCAEWESVSRERNLEDLKFAEADSDNGYQWPNAIRKAREVDARPCLTLNITRQHNLQIINEMKKNRTGIAMRPTGNGATKDSADVLSGIVRHIEYHSQAQTAYDIGRQFQIKIGIGWWRVLTDWDGPDSWDQEIFIAQVGDPLSIYMDPTIQQRNGLDARFAFVFDNVPKAEFEEAYPEFKDIASTAPMQIGVGGENEWNGSNKVRICEYFRKVPKKDTLLSFVDKQTGQRKTIRASKLPAEAVRVIKADPLTRWRAVVDDVVEWKLIVGETVVEESVWPGKYIPLIRCIGEETKIEGILDRKGHTRAMKDAQRMFNYNASGQVEFVALQSKTPWIAPAKAIEEFEVYWKTANQINHSILPYNHVDDEGNEIPAPARTQPPTASQAFQLGMDTAANQIMQVSGQHQNQMGMAGNERTGEAIVQRQGQSDTATLHFADHYADAIRTTGIVLIDLIPHIYDTKRIIKIMAEDGEDMEVQIDPAAKQAFIANLGHEGEVIKRIFNPNLGWYEVQADIGPAFGTRREETVKAMTLLLTQAPALTGLIGDLLLSAMDFKEATEAAQRLKRMVPPQAMGKGPSQQEQQLMLQVQQLKTSLSKSLQAHGKDRIKLISKAEQRDIDVYDAETKRIQALAKMLPTDPEAIAMLIDQLVGEAGVTSLLPVLEANAAALADQNVEVDTDNPGENALRPAAEWDLTDASRRGRVLRIAPLARERKTPGVIG